MKKSLTILALGMSIFGVSQEVKKEKIKEIVSVLSADEMKGRKIGTPENEVAARYIAEQFKKNNLEYCVGNSYLVPFDYQGTTTYNVCGKKSGKSEKSLAFTAHFDHIGFNDNDGDNIYNGADDNASGTAMVVALSEYFKNQKPHFTHIYMAFNGEEYGMLGSHAMANDEILQKTNESIQAIFNFEMLAMVSQYGKNAVYMTGDDFSDFDELLNKHAKKGLIINPDPYKQYSLFYRSDNVSYAQKTSWHILFLLWI